MPSAPSRSRSASSSRSTIAPHAQSSIIPGYSSSPEAIPLIPLPIHSPHSRTPDYHTQSELDDQCIGESSRQGESTSGLGVDLELEGSDSSDLDIDIDLDYAYSLSDTPLYNSRPPQTYAEIRRHVRAFRSKADIQHDRIHGGKGKGKGKAKMQLFDNLRGWTKEKRYRYLMLLGLSLAGDGW